MRIFVLLLLCSFAAKAETVKPLRSGDCFELALRADYSQEEAFALCAGAISAGPAQCSLEVDLFSPFSREESILLCRPPFGSADTADCALNSVGPETHDEIIKRCRTSHRGQH